MDQFTYEKINVEGVRINTARHKHDTSTLLPVVLLHGFPESMRAWRSVAPPLARRTTVVCVDLRGYGNSDKPQDDTDSHLYAKRTMAKDIHNVMHHFGFDRYVVAGHDRGGIVAFHLALDYPDEVAGLVILDVLPTMDTWRFLQGTFGVFGYHMFLLAQPPDYPERLIGADPDIFFNHTIDSWSKIPQAIPTTIRKEYLKHFRDPMTLRAMCEDYRAGAFIDGADEQAAYNQGKRIKSPLHVLWQKAEGFDLPFDPLEVWQKWTKAKVQGSALACGHFLPEEKPEDVLRTIRMLIVQE